MRNLGALSISQLQEQIERSTMTLSKSFEERKQNNEKEKVKTTAELRMLSSLSYEHWAAAEADKKRMENAAKTILDAIQTALKTKEKADKEDAGIKASIRTLNETLETQKAEEQQLHSDFQNMLEAQKFRTFSFRFQV